MTFNNLSQKSIANSSKESHTRFQKNDIGEIPVGWKVVTYQNISKRLTYGFTNPMPTTDEGPWMITATNISEGRINYSDARHTSEEAFDDLLTDKSRPCIGDVLITKDGTLGRVAIVDREKICVNQSVAVIQPDYTCVFSEFLAWSLQSPQVQYRLLEDSGGSTIKHIYITKLAITPVVIPPLSEQKKITEILSSVDEAIASTQAVIDQTRKVKQGLLQEFFGSDKYNKNQDTYNIAKYSVRFLDEVAKRVTGHTPNRKKLEYWDGGIKWISLKDSAALDRVYIHKTAAEISEDGIRNSSAVKHPKGTVVLSRDAGVGKSAITTDEMAISQHFIGWICGSELNNHYLYYWLQYMKPVFEGIAIGNTIKTIGMPFFKSLKIPVLPIETQLQIANTLFSHDQQIFWDEEKLKQLNIIKRGLMQDLLTGRVRVGVTP
ncbi:MAG: restriction endonuclease subunit S [Nostoc desertorum CM1-VF14]|jgi:type I restriction enzyme S subunit|nr:restriction endonuclease subunit S [Nostoc desertorum CM1-VF14]